MFLGNRSLFNVALSAHVFITLTVLLAEPGSVSAFYSESVESQIRRLAHGDELIDYLNRFVRFNDEDGGIDAFESFMQETKTELLKGEDTEHRTEVILDVLRCQALIEMDRTKFDRAKSKERAFCQTACQILLGELHKSVEPDSLVEPLVAIVEDATDSHLRGLAIHRLTTLTEQNLVDFLEGMILANLKTPNATRVQTLLDMCERDVILKMSALSDAPKTVSDADRKALDTLHEDYLRLTSGFARIHGWRGSEEAMQIIKDLAADDRWWMRRWGVEVMKDSPPHCRPDLLERLRQDPHPLVREVAMEVECPDSQE